MRGPLGTQDLGKYYGHIHDHMKKGPPRAEHQPIQYSISPSPWYVS